jgi:hypothetical protein
MLAVNGQPASQLDIPTPPVPKIADVPLICYTLASTTCQRTNRTRQRREAMHHSLQFKSFMSFETLQSTTSSSTAVLASTAAAAAAAQEPDVQ